MIENLTICLRKKLDKGQTLSIEHLANSSIMGAIMRQAKKEMAKNNEGMPTREDIKKMRVEMAHYIIDECVPYL